jgi:mono/diheme cytochrome c family protein
MKRLSVLIIGLVLVVFLLPVGSLAEEGDLKKGKTLYLKHCKVCHGAEGKGDGYTLFNPPVADLTASKIQKKSDKELWESIHRGVSNTAMGMWRFVLSDEEIALVLGYVRSLAAGS